MTRPLLGTHLPAPEHIPGEHWVYFHLDANGQVLYIGRTGYPAQRTHQHALSRHSPWYDLIADIRWHGPLDEMTVRTAERELIEREQPLHNIQYTARDRWAKLPPDDLVALARVRVARLRAGLSEAERQLAALTEATA